MVRGVRYLDRTVEPYIPMGKEMNSKWEYVVIGVLGILVISLIGGVLTNNIPLTNNTTSSNQSGVIPSEPKSPTNIAFPSDFTLRVQPSSTNGSMPIYQKTTQKISVTDIKNLAAKFGYSGEISVSSSPTGEIVYSSSRIYANDRDYLSWDSLNVDKIQNPKLLPNDIEAGKIADTFIKTHGLVYPGAVQKSISHTQGSSCDTKTNICTVESEKIGVYYNHIIDGYIFLPDFMSVDVGENGNVLRFVARWNSYQKTNNVTIISPSEAIQILQKEGIHLDNLDIISGKATITTLNLVYGYADPNVWTDTVVPLYYFKGEVQGTNGIIGWDQYVPAMKTP